VETTTSKKFDNCDHVQRTQRQHLRARNVRWLFLRQGETWPSELWRFCLSFLRSVEILGAIYCGEPRWNPTIPRFESQSFAPGNCDVQQNVHPRDLNRGVHERKVLTIVGRGARVLIAAKREDFGRIQAFALSFSNPFWTRSRPWLSRKVPLSLMPQGPAVMGQ
jgi:hypothetical protein